MDGDVTIRELRKNDAPSCAKVAQSVGWRLGEARWRMILGIGDGFGAVHDGELVGAVVIHRFGATVASIANMIVDPRLQRHGIGKRLMHAVLERSGGATVFLYATELGKPLYAQLGFVEVGTSVRLHGSAPVAAEPRGDDAGLRPNGAATSNLRPNRGAVTGLRTMRPSDLDAACALDEEAHGARRSAIMAALYAGADRAIVVERGSGVIAFGLSWLIEGRRTISPIISRTDEDAHAVLLALAAGSEAPVFVDLDANDHVARAWATELGLTLDNSATRMVRGGATLPGRRELIRAAAGRAFG